MPVYLEKFANFAETTLSGAILAGATSLAVNSAANFPTAGQFRIAVDNEVFLVTAVSGNIFTVTPGYEGTTQAIHNANAVVSLVLTKEVMEAVFNHNLGTLNYLEYYPAGMNSFADQTTPLQRFLLHCQIYALNLKPSHGLDDQILRHCVNAVVPFGTTRTLTCPLIVPEFVNLVDDGGFKRDGTTGTATNNYDGDTTSKALANLYQPALVVAVNGHVQRTTVYCNPDGVAKGAGGICGKNWVASGMTLVSGGSGYTVNDVVSLAQPSKDPYYSSRITVTAVNGSGAITAFTVNRYGTYALPEKLQQYQWTAANGFTGSTAAGTVGKVFDEAAAAGTFVTTGGTGTGATFSQAWKPDWDGTNTTYYGGAQLIADTVLGNIRISAVGTSPDPTVGHATWGLMTGFRFTSLNHTFTEICTNGGDVGISTVNGTDVRGAVWNPVSAAVLLKIEDGGSIECPCVVLDTATHSFLDIDRAQNVRLKVNTLTNATKLLTSGYGMRIGANSTSDATHTNLSVHVDINFVNDGTLLGSTAAFFQYMRGSSINVHVTNKTAGGDTTRLFSKWCEFGTGVDTSNVLGGEFDWGSQTPGSLFVGTIPGCALRVWNANVNGSGVGGYTDENGNYAILGTAAPSTGTWRVRDRVILPPVSGQPTYYACSVAGTPGTWIAGPNYA